jgi:hypothetical protein
VANFGAFDAEIDEQGQLVLRVVGVATYGVVGHVTLGPGRVPMVEGIRPAGYCRSPRPPEVCACCGNITDDLGQWRFKGKVVCGSRCLECLKKRHQRDKDGRLHRWHEAR